MSLKIGNIQFFSNNYYFDFMKWRKITIGISLILLIISIFIIAKNGLNYSIDFLGGAEIEINCLNNVCERNTLNTIFMQNNFNNVEIQETKLTNQQSNAYIIRLSRKKSDAENETLNRANLLIQKLQKKLGEKNIQIMKLTNISGAVGKEDEFKGYLSLLLACLGILIYIALRFDARFAPGAILCLLHNVIIAIGAMTWLGRPFTVSSIAAFLTIIGYSVNDTVIVYDRIREIKLLKPALSMIEIVNTSISQTMNRTILTSTTAILALAVLYIFGGGAIADFSITMLIGIVVGTYSSIYIAAPLTLMMDKYFLKLGFKSNLERKETNNQIDFAPPILLNKKK